MGRPFQQRQLTLPMREESNYMLNTQLAHRCMTGRHGHGTQRASLHGPHIAQSLEVPNDASIYFCHGGPKIVSPITLPAHCPVPNVIKGQRHFQSKTPCIPKDRSGCGAARERIFTLGYWSACIHCIAQHRKNQGKCSSWHVPRDALTSQQLRSIYNSKQ